MNISLNFFIRMEDHEDTVTVKCQTLSVMFQKAHYLCRHIKRLGLKLQVE